MPYSYVIYPTVYNAIDTFYENVAIKYCHTYSYDLMCKNISDVYNSIKYIENGLLRREPTISRWGGMYMATSADRRWNFAYRIDGDTIYVEDACHAQNMHEAIQTDRITPKMRLRRLIENMVRQVISEIR